MANIVLCRIDSRLIHGQVVTKWVGQSQANRIAVVSDELDADPFMKNIYLMAAPPNIKVDCFGNQSFAAAWKENQLGDGKVLVLFPSLAAVQEAVQLGFDVTTIQVGGLGGGPNRKAVFQNITLDEKDVGILSDLKNRGIQVFFQTIPEDKPQSLDDILRVLNYGYFSLCKPDGVVLLVCPITPWLHLLRYAAATGSDCRIRWLAVRQHGNGDDHRCRYAAGLSRRDLYARR